MRNSSGLTVIQQYVIILARCTLVAKAARKGLHDSELLCNSYLITLQACGLFQNVSALLSFLGLSDFDRFQFVGGEYDTVLFWKNQCALLDFYFASLQTCEIF